ncbi:hypothetical protein ON010_g14814 [Phytophthora cinnamomi]|nr:hypothetical protein ON010_g14814 [Phytophthora cinnamomi]
MVSSRQHLALYEKNKLHRVERCLGGDNSTLLRTRIVSANTNASLERDSEPTRETEHGDLELLISRLDLLDPLSTPSYVAVEGAVENNPERETTQASSLRVTVLSHGEALVVVQQLQIYLPKDCGTPALSTPPGE